MSFIDAFNFWLVALVIGLVFAGGKTSPILRRKKVVKTPPSFIASHFPSFAPLSLLLPPHSFLSWSILLFFCPRFITHPHPQTSVPFANKLNLPLIKESQLNLFPFFLHPLSPFIPWQWWLWFRGFVLS